LPPPAVARRAILEFDLLPRKMAAKRSMKVCRRTRWRLATTAKRNVLGL
jgi:hypothetical protein